MSDDYLDKALRDKERQKESEISDEFNKIIDGIDEDLFNDQDDDTDEETQQEQPVLIGPVERTGPKQPEPTEPGYTPKPIPPIVIPDVIPDIIPKIIPKIIPDIIPKQPQKQIPDEPFDPTTPDFPELIYLTHKPIVKKTPPKKRRKSRLLEPVDPFGFEERKYGVLTPDEMLSLGKSKKSTKGLLVESKSKKKRKRNLWL